MVFLRKREWTVHPILKLSAVLQEPKLHTIDWCFWNALVSCVALVPLLSHCVSCSTENWFHKLWFCLDRSFIYGTFFLSIVYCRGYSLRSNACSCFLPHQKECVHCITFTAFRACQGPWDHAACNCCELHVFMWWPFENNPPMSSVRAVLIGEFFFLSGLKSSYFYQGIDGALSSSV